MLLNAGRYFLAAPTVTEVHFEVNETAWGETAWGLPGCSRLKSQVFSQLKDAHARTSFRSVAACCRFPTGYLHSSTGILRCYRRCTRLDLCRARLGASGFVLQRQEWLDRIDCRFFRDRYDAQRVLQQVVLDVKEAKSLE